MTDNSGTSKKKDRPSFERGYLDTAATSLTPEPVLAAMDEYYRTYRASVHRGLYPAAERATSEYERARADVARFIGGKPSEIVFTAGATASANMLVYALEQTLGWKERDEIVVTEMEHHAILLPLLELARRKKLVVKYARMTKDFGVDEDELAALVTERTRIIAVTAASNVTGRIIEGDTLGHVARRDHSGAFAQVLVSPHDTSSRIADVSVLDDSHHETSAHAERPAPTSLQSKNERHAVVVGDGKKNTSSNTSINTSIFSMVRPVVIRDATALAGHAPFTVEELGADFVFFSGHKMCGPTGVGVLWGREDVLAELAPGFFGGGMVDEVTPEGAVWSAGTERFEAGTPNIAGVIGLGAAVRFLEEQGVAAIHEHVRELTTYAMEQLAGIDGVTLYAAPPEHNVGIASFTVAGVHPHDVAQVCADNGVAIRAGHHCASPLHQALGVPATARASLYIYNTKEDVDALCACVREAIRILT